MSSHPKVRGIWGILRKYMRFIGPGLMVSVAYMDPGNYSTAVAAGSAFQYKLLFSIFLSNCLAAFLQTLSAKLGAVTGLDLAANCKENLPHRLNIFMYILAEIAIIATDLAEVVGTAIALNILFNIPLALGVVIAVIDVLIVLMAYRPNGPLLFIRIFESFVSVLVGATVVCFAIELFQVAKEPSFSLIEVLKGFLPNEKVIDTSEREGGNGLFLSLAIMGATVMPHSLYLGSGLVQARLKDFDIKHGYYIPPNAVDESTTSDSLDDSAVHLNGDDFASAVGAKEEEEYYRPSVHAIKDTMSYTIAELVISLFTVALFVNATILIVAGATVGTHKKNHIRDHDDGDDSDSDDEGASNADLYTIYNLLSTHLSKTAGFVFVLALLCSGQSAGVVCTLAGQMVSEGFLLWSFPPVIRRLITRALAIAPCLVVVMMTGREGLAKTLNASQVVLSILLPVVTAPLIYFTYSKKIMSVPILVRDGDEDVDTIFEEEAAIGGLSETGTQNTIVPLRNRFNVGEPAIRLQDLRNAHPCVGWDDETDDESYERQNLVLQQSSSQIATVMGPRRGPHESLPVSPNFGPMDEPSDAIRIKGYSDMSNGPWMNFFAITSWAFVTILNIILIGSWVLGYDVPL